MCHKIHTGQDLKCWQAGAATKPTYYPAQQSFPWLQSRLFQIPGQWFAGTLRGKLKKHNIKIHYHICLKQTNKQTRRKWHFQLIKSCVYRLFWCPKPGWNKQVGGAGCDPGQMTEEKQKHLLAVPHSRSPQGLPSGLTPKSTIFNFTVRLQSSTSPDPEELLHRHQILSVCNQTYREKKPQQQWSDMLQGHRYFQRII